MAGAVNCTLWFVLSNVPVADLVVPPLLVTDSIVVAMSAIVVLEVNPNAIPRALLTILLLDKLKEAKSL